MSIREPDWVMLYKNFDKKLLMEIFYEYNRCMEFNRRAFVRGRLRSEFSHISSYKSRKVNGYKMHPMTQEYFDMCCRLYEEGFPIGGDVVNELNRFAKDLLAKEKAEEEKQLPLSEGPAVEMITPQSTVEILEAEEDYLDKIYREHMENEKRTRETKRAKGWEE